MDAANLLVFFLTSILLALTPGPDNLFVLSQSLAYGRRPGLIIVMGLCTGLIIHTAFVAFGVAAVIMASPAIFTLLKMVGASYLIFLAWSFWGQHRQTGRQTQGVPLSLVKLYRRGFIMNVTNPKVGLFFLAFLPQFVQQQQSAQASVQILVLGLLFMLSTFLVFGAIALLAGYYSQFFSGAGQKKMILNRLISLLFIVIALNLLLSNTH